MAMPRTSLPKINTTKFSATTFKLTPTMNKNVAAPKSRLLPHLELNRTESNDIGIAHKCEDDVKSWSNGWS